MTELLFVYGTLRSGFENDWARALRAQGECLGKAAAVGSIYRVDHFPAFKQEPAGAVHGEVYAVPDSLFGLLDEYEGELFTRVTVVLADGRQAWIYGYNGAVETQALIASGDFAGA